MPAFRSPARTKESMEEKRPSAPRKPLQQRSQERVQKLLDATDKLLLKQEPSKVGLYDIAKAAKVPPSSVYHFFPTKEAAFAALAERYLKRLFKATRETPFNDPRIKKWQDVFVLSSRLCVEFYNSNPVILKLFFGSVATPEIRQRDADYLRVLSADGYDWLDRFFHMPDMPDAEIRFSVVWSIFDGITNTSYQRHGYVTPEFHDEAIRAVIAYSSTFLPKTLRRRTTAGR